MPQPLHLLVADSNSAIRLNLREILTRAGADVTVCRSRDELEAAAHAAGFDAVISDLDLGRGTADNALYFLRQRYPRLPILILTASTRIDPVIDMLATGIFFKPYPDLIEVARYALSFGRRNAELTLADTSTLPLQAAGT